MRVPNACSLDLMVTVDLTNANGGSGDPAAKGSLLHKVTGGMLNVYDMALSKIGRIFHRNTSRQFNMWGFSDNHCCASKSKQSPKSMKV